MGLAHGTPTRLRVGFAVMASGPLLRIFGGIRIGPDLPPRLVAHSWYNLRYGMELLPALALGLGFAAQFIRAIMLESSPAI